jgi:hypothetical protein
MLVPFRITFSQAYLTTEFVVNGGDGDASHSRGDRVAAGRAFTSSPEKLPGQPRHVG